MCIERKKEHTSVIRKDPWDMRGIVLYGNSSSVSFCGISSGCIQLLTNFVRILGLKQMLKSKEDFKGAKRKSQLLEIHQ